MPQVQESTLIKDVQVVTLRPFSDERGRFIEIFRRQWFPQRSWEIVQSNRSDSKAGVLRGLHYHFHQVDYWYVVSGKIRAGLADIRPDSPICGTTQVIELGEENQFGVLIPVGVAHGFVTLSDATLTYVVDNYYDGTDEHGVAWNDPDLALPWGVETPTVSPSSLSERTDFSAGKIDGKLMPCLSHSSELIAGSVNNGSQVQNDGLRKVA